MPVLSESVIFSFHKKHSRTIGRTEREKIRKITVGPITKKTCSGLYSQTRVNEPEPVDVNERAEWAKYKWNEIKTESLINVLWTSSTRVDFKTRGEEGTLIQP